MSNAGQKNRRITSCASIKEKSRPQPQLAKILPAAAGQSDARNIPRLQPFLFDAGMR